MTFCAGPWLGVSVRPGRRGGSAGLVVPGAWSPAGASLRADRSGVHVVLLQGCALSLVNGLLLAKVVGAEVAGAAPVWLGVIPRKCVVLGIAWASSDSLCPVDLASLCIGCPAGMAPSRVPLCSGVFPFLALLVLEGEAEEEEGEGFLLAVVVGFGGAALDFDIVCECVLGLIAGFFWSFTCCLWVRGLEVFVGVRVS